MTIQLGLPACRLHDRRAAGTVIPENTVIEPFSLWMGVPGKFKKKIDDEATQKMIMMYGKNYFDYTQIYRKEFPAARRS